VHLCYKVRVAREFSAGGVLVRRLKGRWHLAAIRPAGKPEGLWALPKGGIDPGENAEATAVREIEEETGARGESLGKLGDVKYFYVRDGTRIFKVVSFFLVRYTGGTLGEIGEAFRHEVADVQWLPLDEAPRLLAYKGEREMAEKAALALTGV
jgi:8-oxo-dGTP pyrophosphatase MutT (NUDIX family)